MATKNRYELRSDYAVHPGEVLGERLAAYGMSQTELADRMGMSTKTLSLIINGKAPVTPETAVQLERVLGVSARLWTGLDTNHRLWQVRKQAAAQLESLQEWVRQFPYTDMAKRGLVTDTRDTAERADSLLRFFGVGSVASWHRQYEQLEVAFRRSQSFKSSFAATTAWLRLGELRAREMDCSPFEERAVTRTLVEARRMTREAIDEEHVRTLQDLCCDCGIALVFAAGFKGTHVSGAAQWLKADKAMLALSLRHKTNDHFWFSFYHEAGHILHDSKKQVYVDDSNGSLDCAAEERADRFACDTLIPPRAYRSFIYAWDGSGERIEEFAEQVGVGPGIVVGRLQHEGRLSFNRFNDLKEKVAFTDR
ncbi:MAG: HigA family addiction module antitoxin [Chloroflexota bacterium]